MKDYWRDKLGIEISEIIIDGQKSKYSEHKILQIIKEVLKRERYYQQVKSRSKKPISETAVQVVRWRSSEELFDGRY